jgi:hypothetical protein
MLNVRRTLGFGRKREVNRFTQSGESLSVDEDGLAAASRERDDACKARMVGFFLIERDGGGEAMAKSSSRLASVELTFSLSSICITSEPWLFAIYDQHVNRQDHFT